MASVKPFIMAFLGLLLGLIMLSQTCFKLRNDSSEDSQVDNRLKKYICWRPCISYSFFCFPLISSRIAWRHISTAWLPSTVSNGGFRSPILGFFRDWLFKEVIAVFSGRLWKRWWQSLNYVFKFEHVLHVLHLFLGERTLLRSVGGSDQIKHKSVC